MTRRSVLSEAAELLADLVERGAADDLLPSQPPRDRADPALHPHAARGAGRGRSSPSGSPPTGPATPRSSAARSRRASPAGDLLAVVATDALELGIDIGYLDAAICVTFPGTVASLRQMWGRAGRRQRGARPLHRRRGRARPVLLPPSGRVPGAAGGGGDPRSRERPHPARPPARRRLRDPALRVRHGGPRASAGGSAPRRLVGLGELRRGREGRYLPRGPHFPAGDISLRSASPDSVAIVERDSGELLGAVEAERAFTTVHPGAVYLHLGRSYEVRELDIEARRAVGRRLRRRLVHPAQEGDGGVHRARSSPSAVDVAGVELELSSARCRSPSR